MRAYDSSSSVAAPCGPPYNLAVKSFVAEEQSVTLISYRHHQAGAAIINWLIVVTILLFGSLGFTYTQNQTLDAVERDAQEARAAEATANVKWEEEEQDHVTLSELVGFRDVSAGLRVKSDGESIAALIESVKGDLGRGEEVSLTLEDAVNELRSARSAAVVAKESADTDASQQRAQREAAESAINDVESRLQKQIAQLTQDLQDEQDRATSQGRDDQGRFDELLAQEQQADARMRQANRERDEAEVTARKDLATADATIAALARRKAEIEPEAPDGEVLSVASGSSLAYIDLGGRDGLKRGTRFELLRRDRSGALIVRGTVEVQELESAMSLVGLVGEPDPFDPMLPGDLVRNPHFESGDFTLPSTAGSLTLSREFVTQRLEDLGSAVDETLTVETDVLVLGHKNLSDEFAPELTEAEEYIRADKLGIRIMRIDDLSRFLRY